jgi:hypothetical protein
MTVSQSGKFICWLSNAALSNKVTSYMTDQKVFVTNTLYSSRGSCVAVESQILSVMHHRAALCNGLLNSLQNQETCVKT